MYCVLDAEESLPDSWRDKFSEFISWRSRVRRASASSLLVPRCSCRRRMHEQLMAFDIIVWLQFSRLRSDLKNARWVVEYCFKPICKNVYAFALMRLLKEILSSNWVVLRGLAVNLTSDFLESIASYKTLVPHKIKNILSEVSAFDNFAIDYAFSALCNLRQ